MFTDRTDSASVKLTDFGLSAMFVEGGEPLSEVGERVVIKGRGAWTARAGLASPY